MLYAPPLTDDQSPLAVFCLPPLTEEWYALAKLSDPPLTQGERVACFSAPSFLARQDPFYDTGGKPAFQQLRGSYRVKRWNPTERYGTSVLFWRRTGVKASQNVFIHGQCAYITMWDPDGYVMVQYDISTGRCKVRDKLPWWWGVTNQTAPSIPAWMKDDAQWQAALAAQE